MVSNKDNEPSHHPPRKMLLLHGSRQTGELLLGRMAKLRKKLKKQMNIELCAIDAPHTYCYPHNYKSEVEQEDDDDRLELTWWKNGSSKGEYKCDGLVESLSKVLEEWNKSDNYVGIIGFSQGARLIHYIAFLHSHSNGSLFSGLNFLVFVAGYDDPLPLTDLSDFIRSQELQLDTLPKEAWKPEGALQTPSLHIFGSSDKLIDANRSESLAEMYDLPTKHIHNGGHHVPMRANDVQVILDFIEVSEKIAIADYSEGSVMSTCNPPSQENEAQQLEELEVLDAIFPNELKILSEPGHHPIEFAISIAASEDCQDLWPKGDLALHIIYPSTYPDKVLRAGINGGLSIMHNMNIFEFPSIAQEKCLKSASDAAIDAGEGLPHVLSCVTAVRDFFEDGGLVTSTQNIPGIVDTKSTDMETNEPMLLNSNSTTLELNCADEEGKIIANSLLAKTFQKDSHASEGCNDADETLSKGGPWKFVIGLVGKPSAGKSFIVCLFIKPIA